MQLRFLGKESKPGDSPTLYATDRDSHVVQGWKVEDREILAQLSMDKDETCVEVPAKLLTHLTADGMKGEVVNVIAPIMHVTEKETLIMQGKIVTDAEVLGQMRIPDYETCIEVTKSQMLALTEGKDGSHN